ncbi:MAG TPA: PLP-dependent aminotransferase family protein [Bryobacteraceae bacterium]|jgi:DNA-binding transcriptional MocR family regulator
MAPEISLDAQSQEPLYRQLYAKFKDAILKQELARGERLPPTRELAGSLGLNRTTVAAAYELLESEGLIRGYVGRGSFVEGVPETPKALDWRALLPEKEEAAPAVSPATRISFAASIPSETLFPLEEFRATCQEVIGSPAAAQILQLGSSAGYGPLRRYLLDQARRRGDAGPGDDILIASGCQQAFDLIQRMLAPRGEAVLLEDPVMPSLRDVFTRAGARTVGVPMGDAGIDVQALATAVEKNRPRLMVLTPNFQNPTGTTLPESSRREVLDIARRAGAVVVENDTYGELRYRGAPVASIKRLDASGDTILLKSFSKIAFPGLRVGWVIGPRYFIQRLTEAKQASDRHSDQLSQAVLLCFAESGRLAAHQKRMLDRGGERLAACLDACEKDLPQGSRFTHPEGGMNVWVQLPDRVDAAIVAERAAREGVSFLPGRYFAISRPQTHSLRLSFAGLEPKEIRAGLRILGRVAQSEMERAVTERFEPAAGVV